MRVVVLSVLLVVLPSCGGPSDLAAPIASERPIVGHLRVRGETIDLTVDVLDARSPIDLHRATARRGTAQVWAGTDDRFFDRDGDR